jgi:hypothetical protein
MSTKIDTTPREETAEEFLARGGQIQRIEHYPDPEGRVLFRGERERQRQFGSRFSCPRRSSQDFRFEAGSKWR